MSAYILTTDIFNSEELYMIFDKTKYFARILSILLIFSIFCSCIIPVYATETEDSLEQKITGLDNDMKQVNSDIASVTKQLEETTARIKRVKEELSVAKGEEQAQYEAMKTRIKYMYENGSNNLLEILFSAGSLADFLKKADYYASISEYDRAALKKLVKTQEDIAKQEAELEADQASLIALQDDLKKRKAEIQKTSDKSKQQLEKARRDAELALSQEVKPVVPAKKPSTSNDFKPNLDYTASASDLELFAALIECEAGSSNYEGMLAVASVVVNRMNHSSYPNTLRGVIMQSGQFPPAHNGLVDKKLERGVKDSCMQAAQDALAGKNNVGNCLSFRDASSGHAGTIIGDNVFF